MWSKSSLSLLLVVSGCLGMVAGAEAQSTDGKARLEKVQISGSSTVYPFSLEAIREFSRQAAAKGLQLEAKATGTSAGLRQFCKGSLAIAAASRPINAKELKACAGQGVRFLELPVAFDAITVVVNPRNTWMREISVQELSSLWSKNAQGKVQRWDQVNARWPKQAVSLCGPGNESGTYDYFNKAINGDEDNSRRDYTASEDDNVLVRCVSSQANALGYFGFDYYTSNRSKLRAVPVVGGKGSVLPSVQAVQNSRYLPLSRPLFLYVNEQTLQQQPAIRAFITSTIEAGGRIAGQAGLIPLPPSTYRLVTAKLYRNVLGSAYAGTLPVGLTIGQILDRSFDEHKQSQFK
ncbi:MAG: PstS family phosphate ABC transporter substrate-binding protein [Synechococcaceae bacterium WB8_1B_136]|nr:PstS family phosphate ABC transporter substrate-binding protein [Synechococcaceae bacterium WB8_1B_136]